MGKNKKKNKKKNITNMPTVNICTPTYNRRKFLPLVIECYLSQDYPRELIEWIVVDDGEDCVKDLFENIQGVKYFRCPVKAKLGRKRNFVNEKASGDILVYMDDDDFYPPNRISHAVKKIQSRKGIMAAGSSEIYIYYDNIKKIYKFGPYGPMHATAGTFAFKKELLKTSRYEDNADFAEEKFFLKNYTVPLIQLDPFKSILVYSHDSNTFDKRQLLNTRMAKETSLKLKNFIRDTKVRKLFLEVNKKD